MQISSQNNFIIFGFIVFVYIVYTDYRYHFSSILETGYQRDFRSNLLYIDCHADAATTRETNVRKFQVHSGKEVIHCSFKLFFFSQVFIYPIF